MASMSVEVSSINRKLIKPTLFGIKLWILILALIALLCILCLTICFCLVYFRRKKSKQLVSNCINNYKQFSSSSSLDRRLLSQQVAEFQMDMAKLDHHHQWCSFSNRTDYVRQNNERYESVVVSDDDHVWNKGSRFCLKEIEMATNGFIDENVIGNGDHGVVYYGVLLDNTRVAVKKIHSNSCGAEDFIAEVELMGRVRHKNLVKLLGYCTESGHRLLVNEYVDNGNLHQWLHKCTEETSPLTWGKRMAIIHGVAKGLAYLHGGIEPKVVHGNVKSCNVLLDQHWNPKISDFGISKMLIGLNCNHQVAYSMSGYLDGTTYTSTGDLNEKSDVYSFGILVMEIITGRVPVDQDQPQPYLIDWLKSMVANHKVMHVMDPKLQDMPTSMELKRIVLLALRCVDPDVNHRPTMQDVIHMFEPRNLLLSDCYSRNRTSFHRDDQQFSHFP